MATEITLNKDRPTTFVNYSSMTDNKVRKIYRFDGKYMPMFYEIQLFNKDNSIDYKRIKLKLNNSDVQFMDIDMSRFDVNNLAYVAQSQRQFIRPHNSKRLLTTTLRFHPYWSRPTVTSNSYTRYRMRPKKWQALWCASKNEASGASMGLGEILPARVQTLRSYRAQHHRSSPTTIFTPATTLSSSAPLRRNH